MLLSVSQLAIIDTLVSVQNPKYKLAQNTVTIFGLYLSRLLILYSLLVAVSFTLVSTTPYLSTVVVANIVSLLFINKLYFFTPSIVYSVPDVPASLVSTRTFSAYLYYWLVSIDTSVSMFIPCWKLFIYAVCTLILICSNYILIVHLLQQT